MKFGLSDKEARVYLTLLELEVAVVHEIAKASGINRSSTYVVLEALQKRGLVNTNAGRNVKKYVVAPPEKLVSLAEQAAKRHMDIQQEVVSILPELKSAYNGTKTKPKIQIFEGKESMITHLDESITPREKVIRVYSSGPHLIELFGEHMRTYMRKRVAAHTKMFGIHPKDPANVALSKWAPPFDESVFIPPEKYTFSADIAIFDDTINYISHRGEYSVRLENREFADAMKSAFDLAFEGAKKLSKLRKSTSKKKAAQP